MTDYEEEVLIRNLRSLADLLERPERGIFSWHMMCERTAQNIEEGLKKARGSAQSCVI
jgi:hypothetical protein